ncbi:hypothetical protein NDU88_003920 [Pleurodeles waltl]|uniref:Uncharacterized protein n=1 Tax=Pleurodeles waltl TaxID=8319 RepID=A0AAV7UEN4_PLEWA|nr:hypothetical protein NDU88_003920 [Pleurodeles waltl]
MVAPSQAIGGSKEGAGMEKAFPPPLSGEEQLAPLQVQIPTVADAEAQDSLPKAVVEESAQANKTRARRLASVFGPQYAAKLCLASHQNATITLCMTDDITGVCFVVNIVLHTLFPSAKFKAACLGAELHWKHL